MGEKIMIMIFHKPEKISGLTITKVKSMKTLEIKYDEWEIIEDIIKVLSPFYDATVMLSNSSYPTISTGYVVRYCLISFLQNKDSDSQTLIDLKKGS